MRDMFCSEHSVSFCKPAISFLGPSNEEFHSDCVILCEDEEIEDEIHTTVSKIMTLKSKNEEYNAAIARLEQLCMFNTP